MRTFLLFLSVSAVLATAKADKPPHSPFAVTTFALSLGSTTDGQLFSLFIVKVVDDTVVVESQKRESRNPDTGLTPHSMG